MLFGVFEEVKVLQIQLLWTEARLLAVVTFLWLQYTECCSCSGVAFLLYVYPECVLHCTRGLQVTCWSVGDKHINQNTECKERPKHSPHPDYGVSCQMEHFLIQLDLLHLFMR